jgi:hypothetical protein
MLSVPQQQLVDDHIFLTGRPPLTEYLGFVMSNTVDGANIDRAALAHGWRVANDHVTELEITEAGFADDVLVAAPPESLAPLAEAVLGNPAIQRSYALMPISIGIVELDRLVVHQKAIDLGQIERLDPLIGNSPTEEDIFRICFPIDRSLDPPFVEQQRGNGCTFLSPSNDFRYLDATLVHPSAVSGIDVPGAPVAMIVVAVGYGINVFAAARIEGRLVLTNGSHRAYALRNAGITHVPCLIQEVTRRDELEIIGVQELLTRPDAYLTAPRPALLKDYFDPELRIVASVPRKDRHVQVGINPAAMELPAPPR